MIVRAGFLVAASIAAYAVKQLNLKASNSSASLTKPSGDFPIIEIRKFCLFFFSVNSLVIFFFLYEIILVCLAFICFEVHILILIF